MSITKFNHAKNIEWDYETEGFEYKKPSELKEGKSYAIHGIFFTPDNGYGIGAVVILDDCLLNAPAGSVETCQEICKDKETVEEIKDGKCGVVIRSFVPKKFKNKKGYSLEFVEL